MLALASALRAVRAALPTYSRYVSSSVSVLVAGDDDEHTASGSAGQRGVASGQQPFNAQLARLQSAARRRMPQEATDFDLESFSARTARQGRARRPRPAKPAWLQQYADKATGEYEADYSPLSEVGKIIRACAPRASHNGTLSSALSSPKTLAGQALCGTCMQRTWRCCARLSASVCPSCNTAVANALHCTLRAVFAGAHPCVPQRVGAMCAARPSRRSGGARSCSAPSTPRTPR